MERVQIELPGNFSFQTELAVRISDINHGGHLGNDSLISLLNEARIQFYAAHGYTELDVAGCGTIMRDVVVRYTGEAFHGDRLRIEVAVTDIGRSSFDLVYKVSRIPGETEIARATTGIVFFDYERRRPLRTPAGFATAIGLAAAQDAAASAPAHADNHNKETVE